jgi:hypothetical protein
VCTPDTSGCTTCVCRCCAGLVCTPKQQRLWSPGSMVHVDRPVCAAAVLALCVHQSNKGWPSRDDGALDPWCMLAGRGSPGPPVLWLLDRPSGCLIGPLVRCTYTTRKEHKAPGAVAAGRQNGSPLAQGFNNQQDALGAVAVRCVVGSRVCVLPAVAACW